MRRVSNLDKHENEIKDDFEIVSFFNKAYFVCGGFFYQEYWVSKSEDLLWKTAAYVTIVFISVKKSKHMPIKEEVQPSQQTYRSLDGSSLERFGDVRGPHGGASKSLWKLSSVCLPNTSPDLRACKSSRILLLPRSQVTEHFCT